MTKPMLKFFVEGKPIQAGSTSAFPLFTNEPLRKVGGRNAGKFYGQSVITDKAKGLKAWKRTVAFRAKEALASCAGRSIFRPPFPLSGPVGVDYVFWMPRPKAHFGTGRNRLEFKKSAPHWHTSLPDLDKLIRGAGDALSGILWSDDRKICAFGNPKKIYTPTPTTEPGVWISVWRPEE